MADPRDADEVARVMAKQRAQLDKEERRTKENLFGKDIIQDYSIEKDTQCIITFDGNVAKGMNDKEFQQILMSSTHRHRFHRSPRPMFRLMGEFRNKDRMEAIQEECKSAVPQLAWQAFPMFKPILLCESTAHANDTEYIAKKAKRIMDTFNARLAKEDAELRASNEVDTRADTDWYTRYQRSFMNAACRPFEGDKPSEELEAEAAAKKALAGLSTKERRALKLAERKKAKKATVQALRSTGGDVGVVIKRKGKKAKLIRGVHTPPPQLVEIMPPHKIAAVIIIPDNTGDGLDEHLLFVLATFPSMREMRSWLPLARPHMSRYIIYDVPMWKWVNPMDRVNAKDTEHIYQNNARQQLYDQRVSLKAAAEAAAAEAAMNGEEGDPVVPGMKPLVMGTTELSAEDAALFAEADEAMDDFLSGAVSSGVAVME